MLCAVTEKPNAVTITDEPGVPTLKYTVPQAERLIRDLEKKRDQSRQCRDKHAHRFFSQWVLELKVATAVARVEGSLNTP